MEQMFPPLAAPGDKPVLEVEALSAPTGTFRDVSFKVREGEIFGIAGLVGSGRTELVRAIAGADPIKSGTVKLDGQVLPISSPRDAIKNGIILVPEDRKLQGVILPHAINENIAYSNLDGVSRSGWMVGRQVQDFAAKQIETFGVKGTGPQKANELSGGNQQKVVIAKWLATQPKIIILDEPTKGIDIGSKAAVHEFMSELAAQGLAVIMVSSEIPEVLGMSDRVIVMREGRIAAELAGNDLTPETLVRFAAGI